MRTHTPGILPKRLMNSLWSISILSGMLLMAGHVLLYRHLRDARLDELRTRSLALVQQHLQIAAYSLRQRDAALLTQISDQLLKLPDVRYLVIADAKNHLLFSKSVFSESDVTLPEEFQPIPCSNRANRIHNDVLFGEALLRIDADIQAGNSPADCMGVMQMGVSLKTVQPPLWPVLAISIGCSSALFGGMLACLFMCSHYATHFMQRNAHALLAMIPQNVRESQPAASTSQEETLLEDAIRQVAASRAQLRERMHLMSSKIREAVNELAKHVDAQSGIGLHHASLTLQYSLLLRERLNAFSQQASDAHQVNETAAAALRSTHAVDSAVERLTTGLDEMRESVDSNMARVKTLNDAIRSIRNAVKAITSIADLTKLIAFNASIEAAGAGKSGGRFSVVAAEVRRLASTVVNSVEEIDALVSAIETAAADLQLSLETGRHKVSEEQAFMSELHSLLGQTNELLQHASTSAQGLFSSTQKSSEAKEQLSADMQALNQEAEQIAHDQVRLLEAIKELTALVAEYEPVNDALPTPQIISTTDT